MAYQIYLAIALLLIPFVNHAQITGQWKWTSEKYHGEAEIDSTVIRNIIYFINSDTKVKETFQYYLLEKNKIYLSDEPFNSTTDKKSKICNKIKIQDENNFLLSTSLAEEHFTKKTKLEKVKKFKENEIYQKGTQLTCFGADSKPTHAGKCLQIAGINFYQSYDEIIKKIGNPFKATLQKDGNQIHQFYINPKDKKSPILAVTFREDKTTTEFKILKIELTGYKSGNDASLSSIRLGDYYTFVKSRLGEPYYKKEVQAAGDETWVYAPIPITIQFRLNKVSSISIEPFQIQ